MKIQNETIRINLDINDRPIRDLKDVLSDLEETISDLSVALGNFETESGRSLGGLDLLAGGFTLLNYDGEKMKDNLRDLTSKILPNFSSEIGNSEGHITGFGTAIGKSLGALSGKAAAFGLLKGAMIGLPILGFIGLIGSAARAVDSGSDSTEELDEHLQELSDSLDENRQAHEDNIVGIRRRNRSLTDAIGVIRDLTIEEDLNTEEKNRLRIATDYVNESLARYGDLIGVSSIGLGENNEEALRSIENFQQQSRHIDTLNEHVGEIIRLQGEHRESSEALPEISARYDEVEESVKAYREQLEEMRENHEMSLGYADEHTAAYLALHETLREAEGELRSLGQEMDEHNMIIENAVEQIAYLENAYKVAFTEMYMHVQEHGLTLGALNDQQLEAVERGIAQWQKYADLSGEMFRKVGQDNAIALDEIIKNQNANYEATKEWQEGLALLYEVYGAEVYQHFRDMGEGGMHTVSLMAEDILDTYERLEDGTLCRFSSMNDGVQSETSQIVDNMERSGELATDGLHKSLGDGFDSVIALVAQHGGRTDMTLAEHFSAANFETFGTAIPAGLMEGVRRNSPEAIAELRSLADELGLCFRTMLEINSPSGVFRKHGMSVIEGLVQGLEELKSMPLNRVELLAESMQALVEGTRPNYAQIGERLMDGLNQGILSREGMLRATMNRIADELQGTLQRALEINSPSRVMREGIGRYVPEGVAAGIEKYSGVAMDSMGRFGHDLTDFKLDIPTVPEIMASISSPRVLNSVSPSAVVNNVTNDNKVNYAGLFDGATIHWHGEEDIRHTMEKISWAMSREKDRLW